MQIDCLGLFHWFVDRGAQEISLAANAGAFPDCRL